jgi:AraC-like DNA-binding protein
MDTLFLSADYRKQTFDRHFHEEFAIGVIDRGCQAFMYDQRKRMDMPAGSVALISPGVVHSGWPGDEQGWTYRMLYPTSKLVSEAVNDVFGSTSNASFNAPVVQDEVLRGLLIRLHAQSQCADLDRLELESLYLVAIQRALVQHAGHREPRLSGRDRRSTDLMRSYLEDTFSEGVSLDALADVTGLSKFQALRFFKADFGLPPHAYQRQVRVRRAHQFIAQGLSLAEVAMATGFSDQAHMTRTFRQTVGYTPGVLISN